MRAEGGELRDGWALLLASCAGFGLGLAGLPFYSAGIFLAPLTHAFGWTAAQAQSGLSVLLWSQIILSPAAGLVADRFGARRVALVSIGIYGLSFMAFGLMTPSLLHYRLAWAVMAAAGAGTLAVIWSRTVNARFRRRRGLALGLVLAGSGLTGFLVPPLAAWLIGTVGWRLSYVALGALPLLISLPLVFLAFEAKPSAAPSRPPPVLAGVDLVDALRSRRFWLIAICIGLVAGAAAGCITNLVSILVSHGEIRASAVWEAGLVGLSVIAGRILCGVLMDRARPQVVACIFLASPAIACLFLVYGQLGPGTGAVVAVLIGLAAGAEFDVLAYFVAAYFGLRRYGAIYGAASIVFALCSGAAPMTFATTFDPGRPYDKVLLAAAVMFIVGGLGFLFAPKPSSPEAITK